jgi:glycolate oxidase
MATKKTLKILEPFETDASQVKGKVTDLVRPENFQELKFIVKNSAHLCIRGGGTGLAGGAVPQNELVLDLSKLDKIENLDRAYGNVEVEAGVILDELQEYLSKYDLEFPVNPSSHSVCTIGGMIATNAVGSRAVKYGKTSNWVNWIDVINPRGEIERKGKTELSDYCGMEGITGVICRASLRLVNRKDRTASVYSGEMINEIVDLVRKLKINQNVSMIEFIDKQISEWLGLAYKYHLIVEFESDEGSLKGDNYTKIMNTRDKIYPLIAEKGFYRIEDPKVMLDRFDKLFSFLESYQVPCYGHIASGILHPCFSKKQEHLIPEIMSITKRLSGQITGEHGIGLLKKEFVDVNDQRLISNIKKRIDPTNKFNQGKVLDG